MICPNINIKEVKDGFNEIVVALGGKPLTDEEFRSSELRNQRQGIDFAAMEATYKVYHRNNGNMLDLAPNGEHSVLFESLLDYYGGNRAKAIAAKSKVYSDEFFNWFGNWINPEESQSNVSNSAITNAVMEFCDRLGFQITKQEDAQVFVDFASKVITVSDFNSKEFKELQSKIAAILMPASLREEIQKTGEKYGRTTDKDIQEDILKALNNEESWISEDKTLFQKILSFISDIINKITKNQEYYEQLIQKAAKEVSDKNSSWYRQVVQDGFEQKNLDITKLKASPLYHVYEALTKLGAGLDGSAAIRTQGTLYRKGEEDFHDLDFSKPYDDFSWDVHVELEEFFNNYKTATNDFQNKDKIVYKDLRQQMLDNCTEHLKRSPIYRELSKHYSEIRVKHAAKTKQLGLFVTLEVDGNPVDIFYPGKTVKTHNINGIKVVDFSVPFAAKLVMRRDKDIRDIINFHKFNSGLSAVSKVVDENGEPLIVWHGSKESNKINIFYNIPTYFADKYTALSYTPFDAEDETEYMYPVFLNIRNPKQVDGNGAYWSNINGMTTNDIVKSISEEEDGVIIENIKDYSDFAPGNPDLSLDLVKDAPLHTDYITTDPNQIKSATNNIQDEARGISGFSTEDDNINHGRTIFEQVSEIKNNNIENIKNNIDTVSKQLDELKRNPRIFINKKIEELNSIVVEIKNGLKFATAYGDYSSFLDELQKFNDNYKGLIMPLVEQDSRYVNKNDLYAIPKEAIRRDISGIKKTASNELKFAINRLQRKLDELNRKLELEQKRSVQEIIDKYNLYDDTVYDGIETVGNKIPLSIKGKALASTVGVKLDDDYKQAILWHLENDNISYSGLDRKVLIELTKTLFNYFDKNGFKIRVINAPYSEAERKGRSSAVSIQGKYATIYYVKQDHQESPFLTLIHELLHIATKDAMPFDAEGRAINDEQLQNYYSIFTAYVNSRGEARKYFNKILNAKSQEELDSIPDEYRILYHAQSSVGEFLSSFLNEKTVRDAVNEITIEKGRTLFEYLRDLIEDFIRKVFKGNSNIRTNEVLSDITSFLLNYKYEGDDFSWADDEYIKHIRERDEENEKNYNSAIEYNELRSNEAGQDWQYLEDSTNSGVFNNNLYSESGAPIVMYRGYAMTEDREASNIEETIGNTAVDYDDSLFGSIYFTSDSEEAADYAKTRTDKSEESFYRDGKLIKQRNRHYTGDFAKVSRYYISSDATVEHYKDLLDYKKNGKNSTADVIVLDKGTMWADNTEYIVRNPNVIMYDNMQRYSPYSTPIFHTTETTQPKKPYVSPTTERVSMTTQDDLMATPNQTQRPKERIKFNLEDNSSSNITSQSEKQRDYLDKIADKLLSAFNILARSYERDIQTKTASRQRTKNKVHEIISKLQELRGVQAITEAVEWGLVNMGPSVKVGEYVDTKTITGFLYQKKQDTDGKFTGLTPEQLYDIYRNGIGFYEKTLLPLLPGDTDLNYGRETIQKINDLKASVAQAKELWAQAMQIVGRRIIDGAIQDQDGIPQDVKDDMKQVAYDWLTTNSYYGDISVFQEYTANFGQMENPIIRIAFNLIQRAETATNETIHPIAAALTKAYRKADFTPKRWFKSNWQKALMEVDKDGIPTGNFVRDINYGQYDKDLAEFVDTLNSDWEDDFGFHYVRDEYGYIVRSDTGERADEQEWVGDKMPNWYLYQLEIERWKADHANKMYTFDYYKERISKPYRGFEDPALISSTNKLDGHGLSPKTLAAYTRIQSNINLYLNACSDEETGMAHPEELDPQDKLKLDEWYDALDNLSNPYNADGTIKDEENRIIAFELRAWQRWIGERTETRIDQQKFDEEVKKVTERSIKENNPRLLEDFYRYNTYTGIHPDYFATTIGRFSEARMEDIDVVQARLIKSSLQNLVKSKNGYTREIGLMENNPQFFLECKRTDQLIADGRAKSSPEFAKEFEQSFYSAMIPYQDEFGNYRTKSGTSITDISGIDHRELMSFWDYLKGKYIDMAKMYGTIPGLVDNNGVPIPITGTDEEIAEKVEELLTYVDTRKNEFGEYIQEVKPLSIFSMIMPSVDVFKHPQTGRIIPTITQIPRGRFAEKSDRTGKYINRDFNKTDNHAEQPKRRFYDNSKAVQRLEEDGLKEVYDECIKYMQESYKKHSPSTRRYDYQLPKMNADDAAIASRMFAKGFRKTASDLWHSMNEVQPNDYGMLSENDRIKSPDGTIGTQLPLRYVGKLEDPSTYTTDVVGAVIMYAHMAENYKNKQEIEAQLNTLMYNLDPENRSQDAKDDSKSLNAFRAMMNSGLYDNQWDLGSNYDTKEPSIYKTAAQNIAASTGTFALGGLMGGVSLGIPVAIAGGAATSIFGPMAIGLGVGAVLGLGTGIISQLSGKVASNKFARMFQRTESLQMLGFNILSMSVGFADAVIKMTRDSIAGKYMTVRDLATGVGYFVLNFPKVVSNIGNPLANCKLVAMMQMNNVSKDTRRIYNNMNYGRTRKLINNICLGGFSMLDYGANCILLKSYYNNIRFYNGNSSLGIKPGWYSKYELKQAFIDAGGSNLDAEIAYFRCNETLWDAYQYDSENSTTQLKDEYKDPSNKRFVPLKLRNRVRTKTVQRGALYNGMNPDNDIPLYKRSIYGAAIGAMRGWLTQQVQHLLYGLDDTSVREFEEVVEYKNTDSRGVQKQNKIKVRKPRTDLQNSRRMTWNYETGLPQDEILHGLKRSFGTLFKKALYAFKGIKDHDAKLSYVEKYAWKDTIVTLGLTAMLMVGWPSIHDWAKSAVKPENREQAGATGPVDAVTRYIPQRFIQDGVYKLFLDDLYFRTIESQLTGFDPKTAADILNALTVYKSAFEEHTGIIQGVGDAFGVTGHDLSEVINRGSYKYYTRGEKLLYKTLSLGQLDNLHTAFSYNGLQQNLNFYYHQYGWIYKAFGYDDFKNETAKKSTNKFGSKDFGKSGFGSKSFGSKKF